MTPSIVAVKSGVTDAAVERRLPALVLQQVLGDRVPVDGLDQVVGDADRRLARPVAAQERPQALVGDRQQVVLLGVRLEELERVFAAKLVQGLEQLAGLFLLGRAQLGQLVGAESVVAVHAGTHRRLVMRSSADSRPMSCTA
jgi:hypothetical protein